LNETRTKKKKKRAKKKKSNALAQNCPTGMALPRIWQAVLRTYTEDFLLLQLHIYLTELLGMKRE
jgi:hypothetical protein